jgi:hypothetical protein
LQARKLQIEYIVVDHVERVPLDQMLSVRSKTR